MDRRQAPPRPDPPPRPSPTRGKGDHASKLSGFFMAYIANTPDDERTMLGAIGLDSLDRLFDTIPADCRLAQPLAIPPALGELELTRHIEQLLAENAGADRR